MQSRRILGDSSCACGTRRIIEAPHDVDLNAFSARRRARVQYLFPAWEDIHSSFCCTGSGGGAYLAVRKALVSARLILKDWWMTCIDFHSPDITSVQQRTCMITGERLHRRSTGVHELQ